MHSHHNYQLLESRTSKVQSEHRNRRELFKCFVDVDEVTDVDRIEGAQKLNQPADVTNALTLYPWGLDETDPVHRGRARRTHP